mgnify:CR=1 FL=1
MKLFKKGLLAVVASILVTSSLHANDELKILPLFLDDDYQCQIEVSLVAGHSSFHNSTLGSGTIYGIEGGFDCPVFTLPGDHILRQQLILTRYSKGNVDITSIAMNPYYFVDLSDKLVLGFGPGIGGSKVDVGGRITWMFTYQAGAGLKYYFDNNIIVGIDYRWQGSVQKDYLGTGSKDNLDNTTTMLKVGYRF